MVLVDTGSHFSYVRVKQGPPPPPRLHEYEPSLDAKPHRMHTDRPCVCGAQRKSPVHL